MAAAPNLALGYVAVFLAGTSSVALLASTGSHIQLSAEPRLRGQMMGLFVLATVGTSPVGGPMLGGIAELTNVRVSFAVGGVAMIIVAGVANRIWKHPTGTRSRG
jgi:MFS family permease